MCRTPAVGNESAPAPRSFARIVGRSTCMRARTCIAWSCGHVQRATCPCIVHVAGRYVLLLLRRRQRQRQRQRATRDHQVPAAAYRRPVGIDGTSDAPRLSVASSVRDCRRRHAVSWCRCARTDGGCQERLPRRLRRAGCGCRLVDGRRAAGASPSQGAARCSASARSTRPYTYGPRTPPCACRSHSPVTSRFSILLKNCLIR
jgi:hypothetical protein